MSETVSAALLLVAVVLGSLIAWLVLIGGALTGMYFLLGMLWELSYTAYDVHWVLGVPVRIFSVVMWGGWGLGCAVFVVGTFAVPVSVLRN